MKKTIAILLVLVIGMVGVFAATSVGTSDIALTTTIAPIYQMAVTAGTATTAGWTNSTETTMSTIDAVTVTDTSASSATAQVVGKLWTRTNSRAGYTISVLATPLKSEYGSPSTDTEYIDYVVSGGANDFTTAAATTSTTAVTFYSFNGAVTGLTDGATGTEIKVKLINGFDSVSAGTFTGSITMNFMAN